MWIEGKQEYLGVRTFERIELPDLTVLIGVNGSGKSQLLSAIELNCVATEFSEFKGHAPVFPRPRNPAENGTVVRIAYGSSSVGTNAASSKLTDMSRAEIIANAEREFLGVRSRILAPHLQKLQEHVIVALPSTVDWFAMEPRLVQQEIAAMGGSIELSDVEEIFQNARSALGTSAGPGDSKIPDIAKQLGKDPLKVTKQDVAQRHAWGRYSIFHPEIAGIFSAYRDQYTQNVLDRAAEFPEALSNEQFVAIYGDPPWEQVSDLLRELGIGYQVKEPPRELHKPVLFKLVRRTDGVEVDFPNLSSGERVLVAFALSIFQPNPHRTNIQMPRLLLLDEMDASLHPEMVGRWLGVIHRELVRKHGIRCILTTHSPITVALAPEDSLFEMVEGTSGPRKVAKQQALNRLTFGLPALSVDYEGRRQVFVEGSTDAIAFQLLADILKADLDLPRTLTFIAPGPKRGKIETNTGCTVVEHIVNSLADSGNGSVFGILDWDLHRKSTDRIKVLAEGSHYAIENVIQNPLLVGALLIRDAVAINGTSVTINDLSSLTNLQAQELADAVQNALTFPEDSASGSSSVRFVGGIEIQMSNAFMKTNGHKITELLADTFPSLKRYKPEQSGSLTKAVVERVLKDWRQLTPEPIGCILRQIASSAA